MMRRFLYSALLLAFTNLGVAQETPLEAGLEATYSESVDLFEDGLYAAARVGFDELLESNLPTQSFLKEEVLPKIVGKRPWNGVDLIEVHFFSVFLDQVVNSRYSSCLKYSKYLFW